MSIKIYPFTHANMSCSWREHHKDTTQIQNAKQKAGKNKFVRSLVRNLMNLFFPFIRRYILAA